MFNFVDKDKRVGDCYYITDSDYNHITNVLRMQKGDSFLVSEDGVSNLCFIEAINSDSVVAKIIKEKIMAEGLVGYLDNVLDKIQIGLHKNIYRKLTTSCSPICINLISIPTRK